METSEKAAFRPGKWIVLALIVGAVIMLFTTWNNLVGLEQRLPALQTKTKNALSTMIGNIKSQGMVKDDFEKTFMESIEKVFGSGGRYGAGVGGLIKAIGESNPNLPPEIYTKLQATIGAEYKAFEAAQNEKVDAVRQLRTALGSLHYQPARMLGGFPHVKIEEYESIVMTGAAKEAFDSGTLDPVDPKTKNR